MAASLRFFNSLANLDGRIGFTNQRIAEEFGKNYSRLQQEHWGAHESMARQYYFSDLIKVALDEGVITLYDFSKTDQAVMDKLSQSGVNHIICQLTFLRDHFSFEESTRGKGILLRTKFRYVDPEIIMHNHIISLSTLSEDYRAKIETEKEQAQQPVYLHILYRGPTR